MVLTQQEEKSFPGLEDYSFHTTMVLTQHIDKVKEVDLTFSFPYHYGSHATKDYMENLTFITVKFPYHYGSHAT